MVELVSDGANNSILHVLVYRFDFTIVMGCFLFLCIEAILHDTNDQDLYWVRYLVMARPLKFIR